MEYRKAPLTPAELDRLRELLEHLHYRLMTFSGQRLAEAGAGEVLTAENSFRLDLTPELAEIDAVRTILGLPLRNRGELREGD